MNTYYRFLRAFALLAVLSLCALTSLLAQNEIVPNPNAILLRNVWMVQGQPGEKVGAGLGSVGDINNSGADDFAILNGNDGQWQVFVDSQGVRLHTPTWTFDSGAGVPWRPVVGDFRGDGNVWVGFTRADIRLIKDVPYYTARLFFYEQRNGLGRQEEPVAVLNTATNQDSSSAYPWEILVSDIDADGDDDLLLVFGSFLRKGARTAKAEIWIYEGGPNFQLDSPSVVLKDTQENYSDFNATIGNLDGDPYPDILIAGNYYDGIPATYPVRMKFWWGKSQLSNLSTNPDYAVEFSDPDYPRISFALPFLPLFDADGDHIAEFMLPGADGAWYTYNMGAVEKNPHNRAFTLADADNRYVGYTGAYKVGYLNDSLRRYEMVGRLGGGSPGGDARLVLLSGGKFGANPTYDSYYSASDDGLQSGNVFAAGATIPNCRGTGWDCYLTGNGSWGSNNQGIVVLLEGGTYIPTDDTTSTVQEISTQEHPAAFHIWPNPVRDELYIAWRGDLKNPPSLLVVYDINGREVVSGAVEAWRGEVLWRCADVSAGTYFLTIYNTNGTMIASTTIIKQ